MALVPQIVWKVVRHGAADPAVVAMFSTKCVAHSIFCIDSSRRKVT